MDHVADEFLNGRDVPDVPAGRDWSSLEAALQDPDRWVRVRKRDLDAWIEVQVSMEVDRRLEAVAAQLARPARTVVIAAPAEVLGPSNTPGRVNGDLICRTRKELGMAQWELAEKVGLSTQDHISRIERDGRIPMPRPPKDMPEEGRYDWRVNAVREIEERIADALGLPVDRIRTRYRREQADANREITRHVSLV